ncbi:hypothetical protein [Bartonella machadoae]|uniref:hypothetical protein n=1 Tax=Bartonella machadoae TaxID=2893471 RepID=UPI001F4C5707|nr:hypothetical protein [Bartonella machadoae]UNE53792.1 hypothetical protein LNM86_09225 [Bartonella machadoae]
MQQQDLPNPHRKLERSQGNAQQKAAVTSLKKAEKRNPEKDLQQQDLSNSHKKLEHSSENAHQKAAEVSLKQAEKMIPPDVRPRKVETEKGRAFTL